MVENGKEVTLRKSAVALDCKENFLVMHEDIDDFEPDWSAYYNEDPETRKMRWNKGYVWEKYFDNKISYSTLMQTLRRDFYEVLTADEWSKINQWEMEQEREAKAVAARTTLQKQQREEEVQKFVFLIFVIGSALLGFFIFFIWKK